MNTIAFAMAHAALAGSALALATTTDPILIGMFFAFATALILGPLADHFRISLDTMSMIMFSVYNALTFIFLILSPGPTLLTENVGQIFWGSILAIKPSYLITLATIVILYLAFFKIFWRRVSALLFDLKLSEAEGVNVQVYKYVLLAMTGLTVVLALRITGGFLVFSLLYLPAASSIQIFDTLKKFIAFSWVLGSASAILGISLSLLTDLPTGSCIVIAALLFFIGSATISRVRISAISAQGGEANWKS